MTEKEEAHLAEKEIAQKEKEALQQDHRTK